MLYSSREATYIAVCSTINLITSLVVYLGWGFDPYLMWWIVPIDNAMNVVTLFLMYKRNRDSVSRICGKAPPLNDALNHPNYSEINNGKKSESTELYER